MSNTIFKVKQKVTKSGRCWYQVIGYSNFLQKILCIGDEYSKQNESFEDALDHVDYLAGESIVKSTTVFITSKARGYKKAKCVNA